MARWQSCNVLQVGKEGREVWQFSAAGSKFNLLRTESRLPNEPLPAKIVAKDWQTLFQPRLNVAWLPADHVFVRVIQLPASDLAETRSMLELQLEKLSPLPVAQIVWCFEVISQPGSEMQTAIILIVPRAIVDDFLGKLEARGYLSDRLELALLDQLRSTEVNGNGVWIYPGFGIEKNHVLMAWWYQNILCHIALVYLPEGQNRGSVLHDQLAQTAWAGELEGWLKAAPQVHVVTDPATAEPWLLEWIQAEKATVVPPEPAAELAARTARRVTQNHAHTNLLPPEHSSRYKQQFVDRIWMRSLGAILLFYLLGIGVYFAWVEAARWKLESLRDDVAQLSGSYTNALKTKEHVRILQDQVDLQYAALECWKAVAVNLPAGLILNSINFERGSKLTVAGSAGNEDLTKVQDYTESLSRVVLTNLQPPQPLFAVVEPPKINPEPGNRIRWFFTCELKKTDTE